MYPRAKSPGWPVAPVVDLIQEAGEVVYVPGGWWHAVLNIEPTVAVTCAEDQGVGSRVWGVGSRGRG